MNQSLQRGAWIVIPAIFVIAILSLMSIWTPQTPVSADTPPPVLPEFGGTAFSDVLDFSSGLNTEPISLPAEVPGWSLVLSETFTTTLDLTRWTAVDNNDTTAGEYYWGTDNFTVTGDVANTVAWAIRDGADGISVTVSQGYTNSVESWLILGPLNMENANQAVVVFDYWLESAIGDFLGVATSINGIDYNGKRLSGDISDWQSVSYSLNDVVGESAVYIAFIFTTNADGNASNRLGAFLDNVNLYLQYSYDTYLPAIRQDFTPTPTATPVATVTPTPTPLAPVAHYRDNFDDPNSGWAMRRTDITDVNNWGVNYFAQQELELEVGDKESYVIAAPAVLAPQRPYNIEVKARFTTNSKNQHKYGIVFAADWNGKPCPSNNFAACFNKYYVLQVQLKESGGSLHMEYMIRQVYDHDGNNNPIFVDLKGWTSLGTAATTGWHEWDVFVDDDGTINIAFNDTAVASVSGSTGLDRPYFGVLGATSTNGGAVVRFDYYKVDEVR